MSIFIAPHNDDEALFGAFTLLREKPLVVVVFDSHVQQNRGHWSVTWERRRKETQEACKILGVKVQFVGLRDDAGIGPNGVRNALRFISDSGLPIYVPAYEAGGHHQHNLVAQSIEDGPLVTRYLTYTESGKSTSKNAVPILRPEWIGLKLKALSCYESQWDPKLGCAPHFLRDQTEYYA